MVYVNHLPSECPRPRIADGSGCICDLREHARRCGDWSIAKLVGVATYAQLLDTAPGLFEPFPDVRADGNAASSIAAISTEETFGKKTCPSGVIPRELAIPPPPNLVSTVLADGGLTPADLKRALINRVEQLETCRVAPPPVEGSPVAVLEKTSLSYNSPELSLGEIFFTFVSISIVVALVIALAFKVCIRLFPVATARALAAPRKGGVFAKLPRH